MGKVESIEKEIAALDAQELARFRDWFVRFDVNAWDRQFEQDVAAGKLDALAEKALAAHRANQTKPL
jgi:uncharacterized protein YfaT (DUF1175 family)